MYIGRRERQNKMVPICAIEADRLSGGIAPPIFKLSSRWLWVADCTGHFTARERALVFIGVKAGIGVDVLEKI
jgi:hypothetical protein